jgi:multidrug resistance efflux pump
MTLRRLSTFVSEWRTKIDREHVASLMHELGDRCSEISLTNHFRVVPPITFDGHFRSSIFRILRVAAVVLVIIGSAIWLRDSFTSLRSEQAVINAEIIELRTPIVGELQIHDVRPGAMVKAGDPLFRVVNARFGDRESAAQYNGMQNLVETEKSELLGAQQSLDLAKVESERAERLFKMQVISRVEMEQAHYRRRVASQGVEQKKHQLEGSEQRTAEIRKQMDLQKDSVVTAPIDGIVWSVAGKAGENMDANKLVMQLVNPSRIWVDAFFAERQVKSLKPGLPALVRSLDGTVSWRGSLETIRAGVGRLAFDTNVAVPPPEMVKRQVAVRVAPNWSKPFSAIEFYGVGRSVEVTFTKTEPRRTLGDALREKWNRLIHGSPQTPVRTAAKS